MSRAKNNKILRKVIEFVKYHNAFTIGLILVFIFGVSVLASDTVRQATIGKAVVEHQGIDNTALLTADLDNFDFNVKITNVTEDAENYYVNYTYRTLDIVDNVWQPVTRNETLTVSKSALGGRDLGLYVAKELGEIVDSQLAYLKEVQQRQQEKGVSLVQETTKYTGLIGLVLNPKTRELPGYTPVVKPPEPEPVVYNEPAPSESGPRPSGPTAPEGSPPASCHPAWVCSAWSPAESSVAAGQQFIQTRTCTDYNNCGTSENKPPEQQIAVGTREEKGTGTFSGSGEGDTSASTPEVTLTVSASTAAVGIEITFTATASNFATDTLTFSWDFGDGAASTSQALTITHTYNATGTYTVSLTVTGGDQQASTSTTVEITQTQPTESCDSQHLNLCQTENECQDASGFWWSDGTCNVQPQASTCTPNWTCTAWQPAAETVACGQEFTQTRTCSDFNGCGTDEGKPAETQQAIGTDSSTCGTTSCDPDGTLHLVGEPCQNPCLGADGCGSCVPTCACADGWLDCNGDGSGADADGCEFQKETATTTCPTP